MLRQNKKESNMTTNTADRLDSSLNTDTNGGGA